MFRRWCEARLRLCVPTALASSHCIELVVNQFVNWHLGGKSSRQSEGVGTGVSQRDPTQNRSGRSSTTTDGGASTAAGTNGTGSGSKVPLSAMVASSTNSSNRCGLF